MLALELLLITFKSFELSNLLSEACVSKMIPGFLTIVPFCNVDDDDIDDDDVLLHCNTVIDGDETVSFFVTIVVSLIT